MKLTRLCEFASPSNPESVDRGDPTLTILFYEGMEDPDANLSGPSSARQQRFAGVPMMRFAGVPMMRFSGVPMMAQH